MDGKEYCNKRVMLGKYRYLMAMVARRGKEAARWNDLAARPVGSGIGSARTRSGAQPVDIGAAKVNALAIEQECDELAEEARRERDRLAICIALVPDADSRDTVEQKVTQITQRLPVNTYGIGCCTVDGKIVYLFGGFSEKTKIYKFDTQSETLEAVNTTIPIQIQEEWCSSVGFDIYLIGGAGGGTYYTSVEKFSLSTPLQQNNLFLQADFGFNNPFPLINEKGIKITAYLRNAYIGNNNNIAQLTNAYLYDTVSSQWKSLAGESYVNDMRNALNILGVN